MYCRLNYKYYSYKYGLIEPDFFWFNCCALQNHKKQLINNNSWCFFIYLC